MATLSALIDRWRYRLEDRVEPYLWSDAELVNYANKIIGEICEECHVIEDRTTSAICDITLVADQVYYSVDDRITRIRRAKIDGDYLPLDRHDGEWMDRNAVNWENIDSGVPRVFIDTGVGTNNIAIYPPASSDLDGETLKLLVNRYPLADLTEADIALGTSPEIPAKFHDYLENGICREAYMKHDEDTEKQEYYQKYAAMFEKDKQDIKWILIRLHDKDRSVQVSIGMI